MPRPKFAEKVTWTLQVWQSPHALPPPAQATVVATVLEQRRDCQRRTLAGERHSPEQTARRVLPMLGRQTHTDASRVCRDENGAQEWADVKGLAALQATEALQWAGSAAPVKTGMQSECQGPTEELLLA